MFVKSLSDPQFPPFLKCGTSNQGNKNTKKYNMEHKGKWQELAVEFSTTAATGGEVAVEKGVNKSLEATIFLDDVKIELLR